MFKFVATTSCLVNVHYSKKDWSHLPDTNSKYLQVLIRATFSLLHAKKPHAPWPLFIRQMFYSLIILVALCCIFSSSPMSSLNWESQNWTQYSS